MLRAGMGRILEDVGRRAAWMVRALTDDEIDAIMPRVLAFVGDALPQLP